MIASLEQYNDYFTTENAIILNSSDGYAYVCNHDGVIVKKYPSSNVENTYSTKYYSVKETVVDGADTTTSYYLENLGVRQQVPYFIEVNGSTEHTYNNREYSFANKIFTPSCTLISRVRQVNGLYSYDFYTITGKLLTTQEGYTASGYPVSEVYADKNHSIVAFEGIYFTLDR